jgi:hypothetical protein
MVDEPGSRYPYADDGKIAVAADADWLAPLLALSFAAPFSSRITLATGILLPGLAEAGVTEFVVVASPPAAPDAATDWVSELAARWLAS